MFSPSYYKVLSLKIFWNCDETMQKFIANQGNISIVKYLILLTWKIFNVALKLCFQMFDFFL